MIPGADRFESILQVDKKRDTKSFEAKARIIEVVPRRSGRIIRPTTMTENHLKAANLEKHGRS